MSVTSINSVSEIQLNKNLSTGSAFVDGTDVTKKAVWSLSGATTGTTLTFTVVQTTNRTITFPDATDTVVTLAATQTLSGKTLTAPVISTISNTGTLTLPTSTDTLVGRATSDTLTNKSLVNASCFFVDGSDNTKRIAHLSSGATTGATLTLAGIQTTNRTITFPDATDTVVTLAATQTLSGKTLTAPIISTISNTGTLTLPTSTDTLVGRATTDTLTNKSLVNASCFFVDGSDNTKRIAHLSSGATTGTTLTLAGIQTANRTITFPDATDTVVTIAATQTLSGKTLDSAANTLTVTNSPLSVANINTLINQALLTSSSPTFATVTTTGTSMSMVNGYYVLNTGTASVTSATPVTIVTISVGTGKTAYIDAVAIVYNSTNDDSGYFELSARVINPAGTASISGYVVNRNNKDNPNFSTASLSFTASSGDILVQYGGNAGKTHVVRVTTRTFST